MAWTECIAGEDPLAPTPSPPPTPPPPKGDLVAFKRTDGFWVFLPTGGNGAFEDDPGGSGFLILTVTPTTPKKLVLTPDNFITILDP